MEILTLENPTPAGWTEVVNRNARVNAVGCRSDDVYVIDRVR